MTRRQFRLLLVLDYAMFVIGLAFAVASPYYLPPELRAYAEGPPIEAWSWPDALVITGVAAILILSVVTTVGLWRFRRWARGVRLWGDLGGLLLPLSSGPVVMTGLAYTLTCLGTMLEGGLLALVYLSPMAAWFTGRSDRPPDGGG